MGAMGSRDVIAPILELIGEIFRPCLVCFDLCDIARMIFNLDNLGHLKP